MCRFFSLVFFLFGFWIQGASQNIPGYVPSDGLVAWWPFNGNANDESGNGNNGTLIGAVLGPDRFGNSSGAYTFNGVDQYIESIAGPRIPFGNSSRSISLWFLFNTITGTDNTLFSYGIGGDGQGFDVLVNGAGNYLYLNNFEYTTVAVLNTPLSNAWHHLVITYDNTSLSNLKMYLDGGLLSPQVTNYR